jgi:hypothetical protein
MVIKLPGPAQFFTQPSLCEMDSHRDVAIS